MCAIEPKDKQVIISINENILADAVSQTILEGEKVAMTVEAIMEIVKKTFKL